MIMDIEFAKKRVKDLIIDGQAVLGILATKTEPFSQWRRRVEQYLLSMYGTDSPYLRDFRGLTNLSSKSVIDIKEQGLSILHEVYDSAEWLAEFTA